MKTPYGKLSRKESRWEVVPMIIGLLMFLALFLGMLDWALPGSPIGIQDYIAEPANSQYYDCRDPRKC